MDEGGNAELAADVAGQAAEQADRQGEQRGEQTAAVEASRGLPQRCSRCLAGRGLADLRPLRGDGAAVLGITLGALFGDGRIPGAACFARGRARQAARQSWTLARRAAVGLGFGVTAGIGDRAPRVGGLCPLRGPRACRGLLRGPQRLDLPDSAAGGLPAARCAAGRVLAGAVSPLKLNE
ncbi:hypothetical protein ACFV29_19110 [Streptomyces sp. NPDC059690]|uniref:hypothetical protein n=1 Tax=Streptomyces sp. NPDC059690 TaxID=3346907 RepID=UPI0036D0F1BB